MSLADYGNGILRTHVTWEEIEKRMQESLGTKAKFGVNKKATSIGDMKGFCSIIALIEPEWVEKKDHENLPEKFICKISSLLSFYDMKEMIALKDEDGWTSEKFENMAPLLRDTHNREVSTYLILMREFNNGRTNLQFPKVYATRKFDDENLLQGYILTEFFPNLCDVPNHECISIKEFEPVVRAIASFSAMGVNLSDSDLKFSKDFQVVKVLFEQFFNNEVFIISTAMKSNFPPEYLVKIDEFIQMFTTEFTSPKFVENLANAAHLLNHRPVLLHGDLCSSNCLFSRDQHDTLEFKALIDFQLASLGSPGQDAARLFATCLGKTERRQNRDHLLRIYYDQFVNDIGDREIPYTFEQLVQSYELFFPSMAFTTIPSFFFDNLRTSFTGVPVPTCRWFYNGNELLDGLDGYTIITTDAESSLIINFVEKKHFGEYLCTIRNTNGEELANAMILSEGSSAALPSRRTTSRR
ncbi:unnamed protein product [Caenorhabditis bovis]|uniref:Ig-like domain-containing protein n=1 Tax=Caenorhabditis bovis TaxID=2654633 RepID=A0A8S1EBA2_9PELO|nr:unnamed protein product [Caenorhabditis bovis]